MNTEYGSDSSIDPNSNHVDESNSHTDGQSCLQLYIEDQRQVDADKKMPYILMLARGLHASIPKEVDITNVEPFKKALEINIVKKKPIALSKPLLCQELKRRNPTKKLNINNKKVDELFLMLINDDIHDDLDKAYIEREVSMYIDNIKKGIDEAEAKRKDAGGRIEASDRLRYIMALDLCGDIREAYLRSQDVLNRVALDARNTEAAPKDFHDRIVEKFNDMAWIPKTMMNNDLHSYFGEEHVCPKRETYSMTREKSKQLIQDMKHKLNEICKRYDRSGNGAGQVDSDNEEDDGDAHQMIFGRFDIDLARLKGGDDRQNFLNHEPIDLLYWWDVMDRHNLIHFTTAQLRGANAATSDGQPSRTSYGAYSDSSTSAVNISRKRPKVIDSFEQGIASLQKGLKDNVSTVGFALCKMNEQCIMEQIDDLTHRKRELKNEWRKEKKQVTYDSDDDGEFFKSSIQEINQLIAAKQGYLDELKKEHNKRSD